jgi:hypothetical protein
LHLSGATFAVLPGLITHKATENEGRTKMEAVLILAVIFFSVAWIVKIVADSNTRRKLIEKGVADERVKMVFGSSEMSALANLKWGMVLVAVGLAFFLSQYLPYYLEEEGAIGLVLIFAGVAFLIYFPIAQKRLKEIQKKQEQSPQ